jgi:hypothetical protein
VLDFVWRYAWAELVAFVWLPPLFLSLRTLALRPGRGAWLALALSSAALLLTHVATATLLPLVLGPYALAYLLRSRRWRGVWRIASAGGVALLLAAVYLVPFLARQHGVHLDWAFGEWFDWRRNFVFRDETSLGFERDHTKPMVTLAVASQAVLALSAMLVLAWRGRRVRRSRRTADPGPSGSGSRSFDGGVAAGLVAWSIYLQTPLSTPVWLALPFLGTVQFPWRFGIFQVLLTALLCAAVLGASRGRRQTSVVVLVIAVGSLPSLVVSQKLLPDSPSFDRAFMQDDDYHSVVAKEYIPDSVSAWRWLREPLPAGVTRAEHGRVEIMGWQTHVRKLRVDASRRTRVRVGTFAFPGWKVRVDGRPVPLMDAGLIAFEVPAGRHDVEIAFEPTWDRRLGAVTSALTAVALGIAVAVLRRRRKPAGPTTGSPPEPSA